MKLEKKKVTGNILFISCNSAGLVSSAEILALMSLFLFFFASVSLIEESKKDFIVFY